MTRPAGSPTTGDDSTQVARTATIVLSWGFQIGLAILVAGLALAALRGEPLASNVGRPSDVVEAVLRFEANGIIDLAILWMIAVPIITATAIAIVFLRTREWRYVVVTLMVLGVLAASIGLAAR